MDIFGLSCYREIVKSLIIERKQRDPSVSYQDLSQHIRIPKSHLSRVIHDRADLNFDQLYLMCKYFKLTDEESYYMGLLLDHERTGLVERKAAIKGLINGVQRQHMQTEKHISAASHSPDVDMMMYYLEPIHQIVHVAFAIPRYQNNAQSLARDLSLEDAEFERILANLVALKLIHRTVNGVRLLVENLHLPRESVLYRPWLNQMKLASLNRLQQNTNKEGYAFAVTFSADEDTRKQILAKFFDFLRDTEEKAHSTHHEHVYQMSFELFSWTGR